MAKLHFVSPSLPKQHAMYKLTIIDSNILIYNVIVFSAMRLLFSELELFLESKIMLNNEEVFLILYGTIPQLRLVILSQKPPLN